MAAIAIEAAPATLGHVQTKYDLSSVLNAKEKGVAVTSAAAAVETLCEARSAVGATVGTG